MAEKILNTRLINKHDTEVNWLKATNFIPKQGEVIVYDVDENYPYERIKVGDGVCNVNELPFTVVQSDLSVNDETNPAYIKNRTHWVEGLTIVEWDGNTDGLTASSDGANYHVSDLKPSATEIIGGKLTFSNGSVVEITSDIIEGQGYIVSAYYGTIYINTTNGSAYDASIGVTFSKPGIYFHKNTYNQIVSFSYGSETVHYLDEKYIPNTIARKSDIPSETSIDDTLSISGQAADSKATGDAINELNALVGDVSVSEQINSAVSSFIFKYIKMQDRVNGCNYVVEFVNGQLVSSCCCRAISVSTLPNKTTYSEGESLDTSGMIVVAICEDGSVKTINDYSVNVESGSGTKTVSVIYTECGKTHTDTFTITVTSLEEKLIDFEYTAEDDGTYTITGWKGTLNGVESTECIIPDNPLINV